jgi:hypothetical protein
MKFTEEKLEQAFIELIQKQGCERTNKPITNNPQLLTICFIQQ